MNDLELKPCPFCGGEAEFKVECECFGHGEYHDRHFVKCKKCGAISPSEFERGLHPDCCKVIVKNKWNEWYERKVKIMKKKLFISCPMNGRTEENIRKSMEQMHKIAEIIFDQELEVIPSYVEDNPPETNNQAIWYLGKSIQLLSEADFFIGIEYNECFKGCLVENKVATEYGIRSTFVNVRELMPDVVEVERNYWKEMDKILQTELKKERMTSND